ncbi:MAG: VTT domain-containing protein [Patescibacteria group bacterium]
MFDIVSIIQAAGYLGLFAIIFAESGLFFGFFLPGDSLLFTAGLLASQGLLKIYFLMPLLFAAAVLGDSTGYWLGRKLGPMIFKKEDSFFFHKKHIERTKVFYARYGTKTIIIARFVPIVRTFAPILAGVGQMEYRTFITYNILGGAFWAIGVSGLGFFLGNVLPGTEKYLHFIIALIIFVSFLPILREFAVARKNKLTN